MTGGDCDEVFDVRPISSGATRIHAQEICSKLHNFDLLVHNH
jgi:hypothetical protein